MADNPGRRLALATVVVSLAVVGAILWAAWTALRPGGPALTSAALSPAALTPNADGQDDVVRLTYTLRRPASVSVYLLDAAGRRYDFRRDKPREAGAHSVDFSGVVDPFVLPGEAPAGQVQARVLPDGAYTWVVEAQDTSGASSFSGPLTVSQADTHLPDLKFAVSPAVFSPNQDGIDDRVTLNVWLDKDIAPDGLRVYLASPGGGELAIPEGVGDLGFGLRGLHGYDYDGGIDQGFEPPADGQYVVWAEAVDEVGQRVAVSNTLTIENGGLPRADILLGDVQWSASAVVLGSQLHFTLTVENYGTAPIRTSGPPAGWVYDSMKTNANTLGEYEQSGAWRVGIMCQTCQSDYPWRWALGTPDTLTVIPDSQGRPQYYLLPGQRAVVTGGIVLDTVVPSRNPQDFWAGLIHEDVGIATVNNRVGPNSLEILVP